MAQRKKLASRIGLGVVLIAALDSSSARFGAIVANVDGHQASSGETSERQRQAMKSGGLRAAAAVTGSFETAKFSFTSAGPADLAELITLSPNVIVGYSVSNVCKETADGTSIVTVHTVFVESVLKGDLPLHPISVILPGGRVTYANGDVAQVKTPGFLPPLQGKRHVLFLRRTDPTMTAGLQEVLELAGSFVPSQGPLSIFDLEPTRTAYVLPSGGANSVLMKRLVKQRMSPNQFIEALSRALVRK